MAALNPILYTERVLHDFLRYQITTYRFSDPGLHAQLRGLLNLQHVRRSPLIKGPYLSLAKAFRPGPALADLVAEGVLHPHVRNQFTMPAIYGHQERAARAIAAGRSTIVSTGTGSGKSEAFLIPIISRCLALRDGGEPAGIRAVIVYPMNALAEDQLARIRALLCGSGVPFGLYVGKTPDLRADVRGHRLRTGASREDYRAQIETLARHGEPIPVHPPEERVSREEMRTPGQQPRILLTNVKMLELLLTRATDIELFEGADLEFLVTDEAHTFRGAQGAETACLLRRLRAFVGSEKTVCVATSATLADATTDSDQVARRFASRFFGITGEDVEVVREEYVEEDWSQHRRSDRPLDAGEAAYALRGILDALDSEPGAVGGAVAAAYRTVSGGRSIPIDGWDEALGDELAANETVYQLSHILDRPRPLSELLAAMGGALGRPFTEEECLLWMALGAAARRGGRPLLRPVLHAFIRGIDGAVVTFDDDSDGPRLWLAGEDAAQSTENARLPILTCTTCGHHYFATSVKDFSMGHVPEGGDAHEDGNCWPPLAQELGGTRVVLTTPPVDSDEESVLPIVYLCRSCGAMHGESRTDCLACGRPGDLVELRVASDPSNPHRLGKCASCGTGGRDFYGSYREPARPVRASAVADVHVLGQNMLHHAARKRLLIFTDNRQDAAFQAGWMRDHARRYRMRAIVQRIVTANPIAAGDLATELVEMFDAEDELSEALLPEVWEHYPKRSDPENHARWRKFAVRAFLARELTIGVKQSIGLEPWGRLLVRYRGLGPETPVVAEWAARLAVEPEALADSIAALLDAFRKTNQLFDRTTEIWSKWWRDGDPPVQRGYLPATKFPPKGMVLRRQGEDRESQQWLSARGVTTVMEIAGKWGLEGDDRQEFVEAIWRALCDANVLTVVRLPGTSSARQVDMDALVLEGNRSLYRCDRCRRTYTRPLLNDRCLGYRCSGTVVRDDVSEDNYDLLTIDEEFEMVRPREHSAQVPEIERERLEIQFKNEDETRLNTLVCTPTLEMGVDIGALDAVLLRNVPPMPANYWQRAGRAGRRHRMATTVTYSRPVSHDRAYFRDPIKMLGGAVRPPRFHLGNPVMVEKHVRSVVLAFLYRLTRNAVEEEREAVAQVLRTCLPGQVKSWVFTDDGLVRSDALSVEPLAEYVERYAFDMTDAAMAVFSLGWPAEDADVATRESISGVVGAFPSDLQDVVNRVYRRVQWALDQTRRINDRQQQYGTLTEEERILRMRCERFVKRIKGEEDRQRREAQGIDDTYTFAVLAAEGFLPGYGLDTGSVQAVAMRDNLSDFKLRRPTAMGLREFVPGNLIYANNRRLTTTYLHRSGTEAGEDVRSYFVDVGNEAIGEAQGLAGLGGASLLAVPVSDVDLGTRSRISDEEELRFSMPVAVFAREEARHRGGRAFTWGGMDLDFRKGLELSLVNVGEAKRAREGELGYWICRICGGCRSPYASQADIDEFCRYHREKCGQDVVPLGLYTRDVVDSLRLRNCPSREFGFSLMEALRQGSCMVLEMEPEDIQIVAIGTPGQEAVDLVLYDPMPGGSGLLQEIVAAWPEVVAAAKAVVDDCPSECDMACIDCLWTYRNQFFHRYLRRESASVALEELGGELEPAHEIPPVIQIEPDLNPEEVANEAEARLLRMIRRAGFPEPLVRHRVPVAPPFNWTEPDLFYRLEDDGYFDAIAIFLDGMSRSLHGNPETAERDRQLRAYLADAMHFKVVTIPFGHLADRHAMLRHLADIARALMGKKDELRVAEHPEEWYDEPVG